MGGRREERLPRAIAAELRDGTHRFGRDAVVEDAVKLWSQRIVARKGCKASWPRREGTIRLGVTVTRPEALERRDLSPGRAS